MKRERVEVKWDYFAFPVWCKDGASGLRAPISDGLRDELQRWSDDHTDQAWGEKGPDHPDTPPIPAEVMAEWMARGRVLTQRLQSELGEDFEVVFGEERRDMARSDFDDA